MLMRFDATPDERLEKVMKREGWRSRKQMRRHIEEKYWVPVNPYEKANLTKKDYEIMKTIDFDTILSTTNIKKTVKKFQDPSIKSATIEGPDIVKIAPKRVRLSKEKEAENREELEYSLAGSTVYDKIDKNRAKKLVQMANLEA